MKGWYLWIAPEDAPTVFDNRVPLQDIITSPAEVCLAGKPPPENNWRETIVGCALKPPALETRQTLLIPIVRSAEMASWLVIRSEVWPVFLYEFIGLGRVLEGQVITLDLAAASNTFGGVVDFWWTLGYG